MSELNLFQNDLNTGSSRLAVRPTQDIAIIKHDARSGALSIIVPDNDPNDSTSRGSIVDVKKVEFVPMTQVLIAKGENIGSNVSIAGHFDLYKYVNNQSLSLGLFGRQNMFDATKASTQNRVYGLIRSVDGKAVAKLDEDNALREHFGSNPVPAFIDLNNTKFKALKAVTALNEPVALTVAGGRGTKTKPLAYETGYATNYRPDFSVEELPADAQKAMADYAKDFIKETQDWIEQIRENDAFLALLVENGLTDPDTVNTLANSLSITSVKQFNDKVKELGDGDDAKGLKKLIAKVTNKVGSDSAELESDIQDTSKSDDEPVENPFDSGEEVDVSDDDLPF